MKLKTLLQGMDVQIKGKKEIEILGIRSHSKQVAPGDLFIARRGHSTDGSLFIEEAVRAGAVAIVTDLYNPFLDVTQVITTHPENLEVVTAQRFYEDPSQELFLIGITGTNGKTTTSYLVKHLIESKEHECGLIGTVETIIGDHRLPSSLTTPDVITLNHYLRDMVHQGCPSAVMEVTSHALIQKRVVGIEFDIAVFTNLSQDHLDYHKTIEEYAFAKSLLFTQMAQQKRKPAKSAVMNLDDPCMSKILNGSKIPLLTYGITNENADLRAHHLALSNEGISFEAEYLGARCFMTTTLVGRFNVYNCLAAIGVALVKGMTLEQIAQKLKSFQHVPGRLQKVQSACCKNVYVDFAHTDDALENVLMTLKEFTQGKLIAVFGCGGDRDKEKRPKMGRVAEKYSDIMIVTSDNPRSEDPYQIIQEMLVNIKKSDTIIEVDRKKAIELALSLAGPQDTVLIAGKGHERTQIFKDRVVTFSDITVVEEYSPGTLSLT